MVVLIIILVLVVGLVGFTVYKVTSTPQATVNTVDNSQASQTISSSSCQGSNPAFGPIAVDAITNGVLTMSHTYLYDAANTPGTSFLKVANLTTAITLGVGDDVKDLISATGYLPDVTEVKQIKCGGNNPTITLYNYANASITVKDDPNGIPTALTKGGGAYNGTAPVAGGSRTYSIIFTGVNQKSTSKMVLAVESPTAGSSSGNITAITISCPGATPYTLPNVLAPTNAGSVRAAVEIQPLVGSSATTTCQVTLQLAASRLMPGTYLVNVWAEKNFVDSTNNIQMGLVDTTLNGNNALQYIDSYTNNFLIQ